MRLSRRIRPTFRSAGAMPTGALGRESRGAGKHAACAVAIVQGDALEKRMVAAGLQPSGCTPSVPTSEAR